MNKDRGMWRAIICKRLVNVGLIGVTFDQRVAGGEGVSHTSI